MAKVLAICLISIMCAITYFFISGRQSVPEKITLNEPQKNTVIINNNTVASGQRNNYNPTKNIHHNQTVYVSSTNQQLSRYQKTMPILNAEDTVYIYDNGLVKNSGAELDADDLSSIFENGIEKNAGPIIDANASTNYFDNSKFENTGNTLRAEDKDNIYDNGLEQNKGAALSADNNEI